VNQITAIGRGRNLAWLVTAWSEIRQLEYDETVTEIDLAGVLPELPEPQGGRQPDLAVEAWNSSLGARLLRLFRDSDG
jgi:hypothetical protein